MVTRILYSFRLCEAVGSLNTTDGSRWMISDSTYRSWQQIVSDTTDGQSVDGSAPTYKERAQPARNPTNGRSCENIAVALREQIPPTKLVVNFISSLRGRSRDRLNPTNQVGGWFIRSLRTGTDFRLDMNNPPTASVGFHSVRVIGVNLRLISLSMENELHFFTATAVGGIPKQRARLMVG